MSRAPFAERFRTLLVVEDNAIIALDLEYTLRDMGIEEVAVAGSNAQALGLLDELPIDLALVDLFLGQETCEPVIEMLLARKIPFVLVTGYDDPVSLMANLPSVPVLQKPLVAERLRNLLETLD